MFEMIALPYNPAELAPYMSEETLNYHYGKHYKTYVENLNNLIKGTEFENMTLEEIIHRTVGKEEYTAIFNNAAQAWNHQFFFEHLQANGGEPGPEMQIRIAKQFGSYQDFLKEFKQNALSQFGSGWAWLAEDPSGKLLVLKTPNADTPLAHGYKPLMTVDVWEHAYYLDYQNRRGDFVDAVTNHLWKWQ